MRLTPDQREGDIESLDNEIQVRDYMGRQAEREKKRTGKDRPQAILILRVDQERPLREDLRDHAGVSIGRLREGPASGGAE